MTEDIGRSASRGGEGLPPGSSIDSEDELTRYRYRGCASPVIIKNCVATAFLGCRIDLKDIAWKRHAEFDPRSFAAAKMRLENPQTTALLFASGKIVCTGGASEESARVAVTKIYQLISSIMPPGATALLDVKIENIVGTAFVGHTISLKRAYDWMRGSGDVTVMYSPELFPGLRFEIKKWAQQYFRNNKLPQKVPETKVLAFHEGNVVITGGKNREDLLTTWKVLRAVLSQFQLTEKVRFFPSFYLSLSHQTVAHIAGTGRTKANLMWAQETTPSVRLAYVALGLLWMWVISKCGVEWSKNLQHERRRIEEATLLVRTMCSVDTNNLAREFAKCEEAHITIADGHRVAWLRAFEHTLRAVALQVVQQTGALSLATIANALVIACGLGILGMTCSTITKYIESANDANTFSPMALARIQNSVDIGPVTYLDMKKIK